MIRISPGSSPLARGLLAGAEETASTARIIPARAGFTAPARMASRCMADHPRSRGVYLYTPTSKSASRGSSPLARGLPGPGAAPPPPAGIIPARAGFTP